MIVTTPFRRLFGALVCILLLASASNVHAQDSTPRVRIDVKTKLLEKFALAAAKNGAVLLIDESDWGTTTELGEDYALWIRDLVREETADSIAVTLTIELREPATFTEGELLATRTTRVVYPRNGRWNELAPQSTAELIEEVERYAGYGLSAVRIVATPLTSIALGVLLDVAEGELPGGTLDGAKLEAVVVGARIAYEAREMVKKVAGVKGEVEGRF